MTTWICPTCGLHYPAENTPDTCPVCADERQWVPATGQRWTTHADLVAQGYRTEITEQEPDLYGIGSVPDIGVGQRGLLIRTAAGNVLWDPPPFVDDAAFERVAELGGLRAVTSSHPHMYGAIMDWATRFDAEVVLPAADQKWLYRNDRPVTTWSGTHEVVPGVTLVQCGGHFPGSAALVWSAGAEGRGALFTGDTIMVTPGQDRVTFMWSAPNRLPLPESGVRRVVEALREHTFDRIYGGWWTTYLAADAKAVLARCADRYIQFLRDEVDLDA